MGRISLHELRRMGVSVEDIETAKVTQLAQRRTGSPVQSIGVIVGAAEQRQRMNPNPPADLTARAMTMCNRDRIAADRYLEIHQVLASRIYSGVAHD